MKEKRKINILTKYSILFLAAWTIEIVRKQRNIKLSSFYFYNHRSTSFRLVFLGTMIFRAKKNRYTNSQRNVEGSTICTKQDSVVPLIISMVAPGETNRAKRWTGNTANWMKIDSQRYRSLVPRRWQMSVFHESTFFDHRATDLFVTMFSNSPSAFPPPPSRILSTTWSSSTRFQLRPDGTLLVPPEENEVS